VSASEPVSVSRDGAVATVTIDHAPVNALNAAVVQGLAGAFAQLGADDAVHAIVVRGAGERAFVAGADISEFPAMRESGRADVRLSHVLEEIEACPKGVVAAIRGWCLGGGLELAMACDVRVASDDAKLGQPEIKLGLVPGAGGTQRLPRLVGPKRALYLTLVGEPIGAEQAAQWGLVEQVVPAEELEGAARAVAEAFASRSPHAVRVLKELMRETLDLPLAQGLERERAAFARCIASEDGAEGVAAFLEKREPSWTGR
jgi:enoyl-CoA hydratase